MIKLLRTFIALVVLTVTLAGCGLIDYYFLPPPEDTAQELYEAGTTAMQEKDYGDAAEYFIKLKDRFPFSPYTLKAEIAVGDAYFMDEEYTLAVDAYKEFEIMHPRHEETPYILYQIGLSNFHLFKSVDLRQENVAEAIDYFTRVRDNYPGTEFATKAAEYIVKSRRILAEHELFVADFYWRAKKYGPAWNRYKYVVENFSDIPELQEYAKKQAQFSYFEYQKFLSEEERKVAHSNWIDWIEDWL